MPPVIQGNPLHKAKYKNRRKKAQKAQKRKKQEFENRSQEPEFRSQEDPAAPDCRHREESFKKKDSAYFSVRASWILAPDSWLLFSNSYFAAIPTPFSRSV
jgi:hypothetical protein